MSKESRTLLEMAYLPCLETTLIRTAPVRKRSDAVRRGGEAEVSSLKGSPVDESKSLRFLTGAVRTMFGPVEPHHSSAAAE